MHADQPLRRQGCKQVDVAFDQRVLGDQGERMPCFRQYLDQLSGDAELAFDRLVGIGIDAQRDRLGHVAGLGQLLAQQFGGIGLGEDLRLEIQPRRQVQVGVRRPRETVRATVLAAAIRVHRLLETHVRGSIAADDAACGFHPHLGAQAWGGELLAFIGQPAVIDRLVGAGFETAGQVAAGSTALDRC